MALVKDSGFIKLKHDFNENRKIILFTGAGINMTSYPAGLNLSWNSLLNMLLDDTIRWIAIEKGISPKACKLLERTLKNDVIKVDNDLSNDDWSRICSYANNEFSSIVKAEIMKNVLNDNYIWSIQRFLYGQCNKILLKRLFYDYYSIGSKNEENIKPFHSLYQVAKAILLCPLIKAVVTYNYDNFLTIAIRILLNDKENFFADNDLKKVGRRNINVVDVAGEMYNGVQDDNTFYIYHVHGYVQSPSEVAQQGYNKIVLSLNEYFDNFKNVYSWQTTTQQHYLTHYTCVFAGISMTDMAMQRMISYAKSSGGDNSIYVLCGKNGGCEDATCNEAFSALNDIKRDFLQRLGVIPVFDESGFEHLYAEFGKMISELSLSD